MHRSPKESSPRSPSFESWFADVPVENEPDLMADQKPIVQIPDWAELSDIERTKVVAQMLSQGWVVNKPGASAAPADSPPPKNPE